MPDTVMNELPFLPFTEHDSAARVRSVARRLGASTLVLYVTGDPGTGRRTLAHQLASGRARGAALVEVRGGEALPVVRHGTVVLLHHPELLDTASQVRVAGWCGGGVQLVAWGPAAFANAAHADLRAYLTSGQIVLPPLNDRGADIVAWARLFVERHAPGCQLAPDAERAVTARSWPGNLTQLEGAIARALALREGAAGRTLRAHDLQLSDSEGEVEVLSEALERFKREYIRRMLERFNGNRTRTPERSSGTWRGRRRTSNEHVPLRASCSSRL